MHGYLRLPPSSLALSRNRWDIRVPALPLQPSCIRRGSQVITDSSVSTPPLSLPPLSLSPVSRRSAESADCLLCSKRAPGPFPASLLRVGGRRTLSTLYPRPPGVETAGPAGPDGPASNIPGCHRAVHPLSTRCRQTRRRFCGGRASPSDTASGTEALSTFRLPVAIPPSLPEPPSIRHPLLPTHTSFSISLEPPYPSLHFSPERPPSSLHVRRAAVRRTRACPAASWD